MQKYVYIKAEIKLNKCIYLSETWILHVFLNIWKSMELIYKYMYTKENILSIEHFIYLKKAKLIQKQHFRKNIVSNVYRKLAFQFLI